MSAPIGNRFWEVRSTHGRNPTFASPDDMWLAACEYFEWAEANPLKGEKLFSHNGRIVHGEFSKMRALTIEGLCNFLGITSRAWRAYREKEDFVPIIERVEQVMFEQKFAGAAADLLNANIIARDLGLADKAELTGKDGGPIRTEEVSARDLLSRRIASLAARNGPDEGSGEPDGKAG